MSIQTQINRISGNISSALAAIADKGVTVPSGSKSDALAGLIGSIEVGGGLPVNITLIATGTYTSASTTQNIIIEHGLGITPNFLLIRIENYNAQEDRFYTYVMNYAYFKSDYDNGGWVKAAHNFDYYFGDSSVDVTDSSISVTVGPVVHRSSSSGDMSQASAKFKAGHIYTWIAGVYA